jgi:hypothetical protein
MLGMCIACLISAIVGTALFAAGAWFRHRYIRPPVQLPPGANPWEVKTDADK